MGICLWQHCQSPESWSCSPCSWATPPCSNLPQPVPPAPPVQGHLSYLCLCDNQIQVCLYCHEPWGSSAMVYEQTLPSAPLPLFFTATVPEPQANTNHCIISSDPRNKQVSVCSPICSFSQMCSFISFLSYQNC